MDSEMAPTQMAQNLPHGNGPADPSAASGMDVNQVPHPMAGVPPGSVPQGLAFQSASLYVGDLHPDVTEALLYDMFNAVGPVASVRVCRDAITRRSLGYAYVNFHNTTDAERALDTMNYTLIKDRPCRMMWSQRDPALRKNGAGNVFVKHLDLSIDNKALYDTFSLFGNILSCKVVTDHTGKSRGYGFVHFETTEAADEAIKKINGMLIAGKEVFVGKFLKRNERPSQKEWTNLYVKNIPTEWGTAELEDFFADCGPISSAKIMTDQEGKSRGFGFVDFVEHSAAKLACETKNGHEFPLKEGEQLQSTQKSEEPTDSDDKAEEEQDSDEQSEGRGVAPNVLVVCRAQKKSERERELTAKFEEMKLEQQTKYQGVNLYVKNLDDRLDDDALKREFDQFGVITSARVMRDKPIFTAEGKQPGASKGFGFVCFSTPAEAIQAVSEMNGRLVLGKPIYVALAQRKDQRRAQLEAQHRQQQRMMSAVNVPVPPMMNMHNMGNMGMPNMMFPQPPQFQQQQQRFQQGPGAMPRGPMGGVPRGMNPMNGQNMGNMPPMPRQQGPGAGGVQFNNNARNTMMPGAPNARGMGMNMGMMAPPQQPQRAMTQPLNPAALANADPEERKGMIGEKLYPMVFKLEQAAAGKITGMLLEMDNHELLHLLESPESLAQKVREAMEVLQKAKK